MIRPPHPLEVANAWIAAVAMFMVTAWLALGAPTSPGFSQLALVILAAGFSAAAVLLFLGARQDPRAENLGHIFLLVAATYADWRTWTPTPAVEPIVSALAPMVPAAFLPYFIWRLFLTLPRLQEAVPASSGRTTPGRGLTTAAYVLGVTLFGLAWLPVERLVGLAGPWAAAVAWAHPGTGSGGFWTLILAASAPAMVVSARRSRRAPLSERKRIWLLWTGWVVFGLLPLVQAVALVGSPWLAQALNDPYWLFVITAIEYGSLFCLAAVTAYAILARRALDIRVIVRQALQYALARNTLHAVMTLPVLAVVAIAYRSRNQTLADLSTGSSGVFVASLVAIGALLLQQRGAILLRLDERYFRASIDSAPALGRLAEISRQAADLKAWSAAVSREFTATLQVATGRVYYRHPSRGDFEPGASGGPSLSGEGALAGIIAAAPDAIDCDGIDPVSLPFQDQRWLHSSTAKIILPLRSSMGGLLGAITLGEKRSELPFSSEDRSLGVALAESSALALENRLLQERFHATVSDPGERGETDLAPEALVFPCRDCGALSSEARSHCSECSGLTASTGYPALLAGKYRLLRVLGSGGMGVVFLGRDEILRRQVAIKTLPRLQGASADGLRREAEVMASLSHPGIATIHAIEIWMGMPFLIVEYFAVGTLREVLAQQRLPVETVARLGLALCEAIGYLHARGLLHRDIKPNNIAYESGDVVKLLDFGLAGLLDASSVASPMNQEGGLGTLLPAQHQQSPDATSLSADNRLVGTPLYLCPEALNGFDPDPSFDLWAFHMVLYEALAGCHPWAGKSTPAVLFAIAKGSIPPLTELRPSLPAILDRYFAAALSPSRDKRPKDAEAAAHNLAVAFAL